MNEQSFTVPSGGTAWFTTVPTHGQANTLRRSRLRLSRFLATDRDGWRDGLTPDEQDARDEAVIESTSLTVRTLVSRWEGVRAPNGDPLTFPDDVDRMAEGDIQALFAAITTSGQPAGESAGGADPN